MRILLILLASTLSAGAALYPASAWFGTNLMTKTNAAGVNSVLGITAGGPWQPASDALTNVTANLNSASNVLWLLDSLKATIANLNSLSNQVLTAINASTAALGTAAWTASSAYDAAGVATSATNSLTAVARWTPTQVSNAAASQILISTNNLGPAAYLSLLDVSNKAAFATNGYAWGSLYDASGAALNATNSLGSSAWLTKLQVTNIASGQALLATNPLGTAAYTASSAYDVSGAALNATNNLGTASWLSKLQVTNAADAEALLATNNLGTASWLSKLQVTNAADAEALLATNSLTAVSRWTALQVSNAAASQILISTNNLSAGAYQSLLAISNIADSRALLTTNNMSGTVAFQLKGVPVNMNIVFTNTVKTTNAANSSNKGVTLNITNGIIGGVTSP